MNWISVKDRLPGDGENVVVLVGGYLPGIKRCIDGRWSFEDDSQFVTHWMPLPEPPKRESSFERWWKENGAFNKQASKTIWEAAIKASKQPDFVE